MTAALSGIHQINLRASSAYLLETDPLTLVDCGMPGSGPRLRRGIEGAGHRLEEIKRIIVTHAHADHFGGLAEAKQMTGAAAWMHPLDAAIVRSGSPIRPASPAPGFAGLLLPLLKGMFRLGGLPAVPVEHELSDGEVFAGGIRVIHAPGASAGQVALLWNRTLIAADAFANVPLLGGHQFGYEDLKTAQQSMRRLVGLDFDNAVFGHGKPIVGDAATVMRQRFRRSMGERPGSSKAGEARG